MLESKLMRLLFLGDVVGRSGRIAICELLPGIIRDYSLDFVAINAENIAGGFGITESLSNLLFQAGADVITTGNHVWDQPNTAEYCAREHRVLRPLNFPPETLGYGTGMYTARNGANVLVANIMGQVFMRPTLDDPFAAAEKVVSECELSTHVDAILIDFHAEATSEKQALGHLVDGRASLVVGTHTHVPTADAKILSGGTGYITDLGMCGDYDSSLGMDKEEPLQRFISKRAKSRYEVAKGPATICGVGVNISDRTGLVEKIAAFRMGPHLEEAIPAFWL